MCRCFNSMKVRLKLYLLFRAFPTLLGFNSMKVRLKHKHGRPLWADPLFQFHEGPIKTFNFEVREHGLIMFQFHEGPIKTLFFLTSEQPNCVSIP